MKKFLSVLMGLATATVAAISLPPASPSDSRAEAFANDFVCSVLLPTDYEYLAPVTDLAADEDMLAVISGGKTVIFDLGSQPMTRTALSLDAIAVSAVEGVPATLASDGTLTVHSAVPASLVIPDALDFCFAGGMALVLTEHELLRIPYAETGFDTANALSPLALTHGAALRLAASDSTAAVVAEYDSGYKLFSVKTQTGVNWDTIQNLNAFSDVAVSDQTVLTLSVSNGLARIRSFDNAIDVSLSAEDYRLGGMRGAVRFGAVGEKIYVAGNSADSAAINRYDLSSGETPTLTYALTQVASEGSEIGYFRRPASALPYGEGVFVADTDNNRVQFVTQNRTLVVSNELDRPYALAAAGNQVTVADREGARLSVFEYISDAWRRSDEPIRVSKVTDLAARGDGKIWIADGGSIRVSDGKTVQTAVPAVKIAANDTDPALYYLSGAGEIRRIFDGEETLLATVPDCVDLDVDAEGAVYALSNDSIVVIDDGSKTSHRLVSDRTENAAAVSISIVREGAYPERGALLLSFPKTSSVGIVSGENAGAATVDWSAFAPPVDVTAQEPAADWTLRTAPAGSRIYAYPSAEAPSAALAGDARVLVVSEPPALGFFAQIAYERFDGTDAEWVTGFALRSSLTADTAPAQPPFKDGYLLHPAALYKYPSLRAVKLGELEKGSPVTLCAMPPVTDTANRAWVAVAYADGVVYTLADNVMKRHYTEPVKNYKADATVLGGGTAVYALVDGKYEVIEGVILAKGARVMLVGAYDRRADYTHIRYADETFGLLDCYVAAASIDPDRLGTAESVAIALMIVTLISGAVLIAIRKKS